MIQNLVIFHFEVVFDRNFEEKPLVAIAGSIQHFDDLFVVKMIDLQNRYFEWKITFLAMEIVYNIPWSGKRPCSIDAMIGGGGFPRPAGGNFGPDFPLTDLYPILTLQPGYH